jgi:hypothetical protein
LPSEWSGAAEEVAASVLGSLLAIEEKDRQDLLLKALFDASRHGLDTEVALRFLTELRTLLEKIL